MPFNRVTNDIPGEPKQRVALDERFITQLLPESVQDRIEGQELRQILLACLQTLSPAEHRVIELRFQHKKSRGQVASQLALNREQLAALEESALNKLRGPVKDYLED